MKPYAGKARRRTQFLLFALIIGLAVLQSARSVDAETTTTTTLDVTGAVPANGTRVPARLQVPPAPTSTPPPANAPTFISAPSRVDMVSDPVRRVLYITSGGQVLRYSLDTQQFLTPFALGGNLMGIDLSPDANTLAVADSSSLIDQAWIHLVDLQTGTSRPIAFPIGYPEGGTFTVAYGSDGRILITSRFPSSSWVPLRRYDPATGVLTSLYLVHQDTMLSSSADGRVIGFAESDSPDGPWGRYRVWDESIVERIGYTNGTSGLNYEIGTNRNGTQFSIPTYGGTFVYSSSFTKIATLGVSAGPQPIGVVYHPTQDIVYFAWAGTQEVRGFETATFSQVSTFNMGYTFQQTGNQAFTQGRLRISRDGALLFAAIGGGVGYVSTTKAIDINTLIADVDSACAQDWINKKSVCNKLDNELTQAKQAIDRGQTSQAKRKLADFISQLDAELGKTINQQAYDLLKPAASYFIGTLP